MRARTTRSLLAAAVLVTALVGCASADTATDTPTVAAATTATPAPLTAQQVIDAFAAVGLPVPNPRDNSANCEQLGCTEQFTTDAVSVYVWPDEGLAQHQVDVGIITAHRVGLVVLSFAPGQATADQQPRYVEVLEELVADPASAPTAGAPPEPALEDSPEAAAFAVAFRQQFPELAEGRDDGHIGRDGVRVCTLDLAQGGDGLALSQIPLRFERNGIVPDAATAQAILDLAKTEVCGPLGLG